MVQLFKDQLLGIGSYGAVCKAKSGELLCAVKIINPNLLDPAMMYRIPDKQGGENSERGEGERWTTIRWFDQESEFLFKLRHPNLLQYHGLCRDPDTGLPVLLMELMMDNLTHYLKTPGPIPYHIQVNICCDVAQALSFLHSSNIIHKNLCSNNVLLTNNDGAKVTDFGMATLADLNPQSIPLPSTAIQDKLAYMPPEAVKEHPVYTERMDSFSFGVIIVQILTRRLPNPGNRWKHATINHPGVPKNIAACTPITEVERRRDHIDLIDQDHSLLPIALDCLKDKAIERPSAKQLCKRLATLKEGSKYKKSVNSTMEQRSEQASLDSKDKQIMELQARVEALTKELAERDHMIARQQEEAKRVAQKHQQEVQSLQEKIEPQEDITIPEWLRVKSNNGHKVNEVNENGGTEDESKGNSESNLVASTTSGLKGEREGILWCYGDTCIIIKCAYELVLESYVGERWSCCHCKFSNHPLMSRCEACNCPNR